jgi:hypothetical protein
MVIPHGIKSILKIPIIFGESFPINPLWKSILYGAFVWARRALNSPKWRFPARAVVDIVFNFRTRYTDINGNVVTNSKAIAMNYARGWFVVDIRAANSRGPGIEDPLDPLQIGKVA